MRNTHHRFHSISLEISAAALFALSALSPAAAQASTDGGAVTIVLPWEPPGNIDGCQSSNQFEGIVSKDNIVETLIERDPRDGSLEPKLALSWEETAPDTWTVHLRHDVVFHDGSPLNAAAVKKSLDRSFGNKIVCTDRAKFFNKLTIDTTVVDDYTLRIKTSTADPILPTRLSGMGIVGPNTPVDAFVQNPVGTGPYQFDQWQPGQQILLKRNDRYWGPKPQANGVRYIWRDESSVRAAMVKVGEADIAADIGMEDATDPALDHSYATSETTFLRIDAAIPPLNDRRVRLALNYAFDHDALRGSVLSKDVADATQLVVPSISGHNAELDKSVRPYDPDKAKQLLAEAKAAGVPVDAQITLYGRPSSYPHATEVMEAILAMYQAIGLNVKLAMLEPGQYTSVNTKPFADSRPPSLLQSIHDNDSGDAVITMASKLSCSGATSAYCDPDFDKEIQRVSALTGEERRHGWEAAFKSLYEDGIPVVWMYHMVGYMRVSPRINFVPDVRTNNEIDVREITFK